MSIMIEKRTKKIKKGDQVYVLSGDSKGCIGTVVKIVKLVKPLVKGKRKKVKAVHKAVIEGEGIQTLKCHKKASSTRPSGIVTKPVLFHLSKLALVAPSGAHGRVGFKVKEDGKKVRVLDSGEEIDV